jgi:uncharacterized surface protein with fasciclin (FAS1) repeats
MRILSMLVSVALLLTAGSAQILAQSYPAQAQSAPQPAKDVITTVNDAGTFKTFVKAVQEAGLEETLKGRGPFTVFAPNDEAFAKLPAGTLDALMKDKQKLSALLSMHVVPTRLLAADITKMQSAKTVNGQELAFTNGSGAQMVENARIIRTDMLASNGVVHVIDAVIQPKQ